MRLGFALLICVFLTSCEEFKHFEQHDPSLGMPKHDYEQALTGQGEYKTLTPPPKKFHKRKKLKTLPDEFNTPVSIAITDAVPLKEVFLELARQAKVGISISPNVKGGLFFQAQNQPFINIIRDICESADLRFRVSGTIIKIEPDAPYSVTYNVQHLSQVRKNQNRISMATDVFTAMEGHNREMDNGSSTVLTAESQTNFWEELSDNLETLLDNSNFTIHQQAGLITVNGKQKQHNLIAQYLKSVTNNTTSQVLIEAKIVEVNLNEEYQSGINWQRVARDFRVTGHLGDLVSTDRNVFTIGTDKKSLTGLVSILDTFGTVRTLSSPRLTVMNNQSAVLKVATNHVFFKINYSRELGGMVNNSQQRDLERASSQIQTVPIGLVMMVHPTIDLETGKVTMTIRPTISRVVDEKEDPAVSILSKNTKVSKIPEVQVRELDSVLQVDSGEIVVMGGLMEERSDNQSSGVPGLQEIFILGNLFKSKEDKRNISELVVILCATIMDDETNVTEADAEVYHNFTQDPRPFVMGEYQETSGSL